MEIISNMHTHSLYSDGKSTLRENIESALAMGFTTLGCSDHSYTPFDLSYCMKKESLAAYRAEVDALNAEYAGRIHILRGIEHDVDSDPSTLCDYEYFIASTHYVEAGGVFYPVDESREATLRCIAEGFGGDRYAFYTAYYENVMRCALLRPDILGHFDLLTKHDVPDETDKKYRGIALSVLDAVLALEVPLEINTGAMARGLKTQPYPSAFLLRRIAEKKGMVTLGSDSHHKDNLAFGFPAALEALHAAGVRQVLVRENAQWNPVAI